MVVSGVFMVLSGVISMAVSQVVVVEECVKRGRFRGEISERVGLGSDFANLRSPPSAASRKVALGSLGPVS